MKQKLSAFLAMIMCLSILVQPVFAEEIKAVKPEAYRVQITETEGGTITCSEDEHKSTNENVFLYQEKDLVALNIVPDDNFEMTKISIQGTSEDIEYSIEDDKVSFLMPASDVHIQAEFNEKGLMEQPGITVDDLEEKNENPGDNTESGSVENEADDSDKKDPEKTKETKNIDVYLNFYDESLGDSDDVIAMTSSPAIGVIDGDVIKAKINPHPDYYEFSLYEDWPRVYLNYSALNIEQDITDECSYDARAGVITIPAAYKEESITVKSVMGDESYAYVNLVADEFKYPLVDDSSMYDNYRLTEEDFKNNTLLRSWKDYETYPEPDEWSDHSGTWACVVNDTFERTFDPNDYRVGQVIQCNGAFVSYLNETKMRYYNMSDYINYDSGFGFAVMWFCDDPVFHNIGRSNNSNYEETWKWEWLQTGQVNTYTWPVSKWNWMFGQCVQRISNATVGNPIARDAKIMITDIAGDGTMTCFAKIWTSAQNSENTSTGAQNVGLYFRVKPLPPKNGKINLEKVSANSDLTNNNSCYSLEGAVYGIYNSKDDAVNDINCIETLTTAENGASNKVEIASGDYYVKELTAPKGFALDNTIYTVTVEAEKTATVIVKDFPQSDPVSVLLGKVDKDTNANKPQGSASLEGAEFTIKYYDGYYESDPATLGKNAVRTWVLKTDSDGFCFLYDSYKVSGDEFYKNSKGITSLPLGTLTIQETKAPEGYFSNDEVYVRQITSNGTAESVTTYNQPIIPEQVIKGDIEIIKFGEPEEGEEDVIKGLTGAEFTFTSKTTGKVVTKIITENGFATTHVEGNAEGTLPFDTYIVSESVTPKGYEPIEPFEVTISEAVTIRGIYLEDKLVVSPVNIVKVDATTGKAIPVSGAKFRILNAKKEVVTATTYYPEIKVNETFTTDENGQFMFPKELKAGTYYLEELEAPEGYLKGEVIKFTVDQSGTWENPLIVKYADVPAMGKITLQKVDDETGDVIGGVEFTVIATEDVITPDGTIRATKGDIVDTIVTDENGVATTKELFLGKYTVQETGRKDGYALADKGYEVELTYQDQDTEVVVEDIGTIKNRPTTYVVNKVDAENKKLKGVTFKLYPEGNPESAQEYTTDKNGQIVFKYMKSGKWCLQEVKTLPGYMLNEKVFSFVVDDNGRINGKDTEEITIENHRTQIIETTAQDNFTLSHVGAVLSNGSYTDFVKVKNMNTGYKYKFVSVPMDKNTGKALKDAKGNEIRVETTIVADQANMIIDIPIKLDASQLPGVSMVFFEYMYSETAEGEFELISEHTDLTDEGQTIHFPEIHTMISDENGNNILKPEKNQKLIDHVSLKNLIPGEVYKLDGLQMDKKTEKEFIVNGNPVKSSKEFTATEEEMVVEIVFEFDGSGIKDEVLVTYEDLSVKNHETEQFIEVNSHRDIDCEEQTVRIKIKEGKIVTKTPNPTQSVKTGDSTVVIPYILLACAAGAVIVVYQIRRKKINHEG